MKLGGLFAAREVADLLFNRLMDQLTAAEEENAKKLIPFLEKPTPAPKIEPKRLLAGLEQMVNEAFVNRDPLARGDLEAWQDRARYWLLFYLADYARKSGNKALLCEIGELDDRFKPRPPLSNEQLAELQSLEAELEPLEDQLLAGLQVVDAMRRIVSQEAAIVAQTNGERGPYLRGRVLAVLDACRAYLTSEENIICGRSLSYTPFDLQQAVEKARRGSWRE